MTTLEKIEKKRELRNEIHYLECEIRDEQRKCKKHEYPEKALFDSKYFYARCVKCGYEHEVQHNVDVFNDEKYSTELNKKWDILILNKKL